MFMRRLPVPALAFLLAAASSLAGTISESTVVSCPFGGASNDRADSGIIVLNYQGNNVRRVHIGYGTDTTGQYLVTMTIRRGAYDGPVVGSSSIYLNLNANVSTDVDGYFHFGGQFDGAPVTPGDTLTITHTWSGPGILFFDAGNGDFGSSGNCGGAYETIGTSSPVDVQVRGTMGIEIDQQTQTTSCIKSDTVLCIDNAAGDMRFKLTVNFAHAGKTGVGQASLGTPGLGHGGSFWFISQDNPEILVKVLPACGVNNKFWVFIDAGTNQSYSLNVLDTMTGATKTYSNPDNTAAVPVQDTSAFGCP